jgi:hypothetical protein
MLNVGWLERERPYKTGPVPSGLRRALQRLARDPKNLSRGFHVCDLCDRPRSAEGSTWLTRLWKWSEGPRGNGEIHVRSRAGDVYAAPVLVVHYVKVHGYCPPEQFIQAVLETSADER